MKEVQKFWSSNPCDGDQGELEDLQRWHRAKEPEHYKDFEAIWAGPENRILEVGCGQGSDLSQILRRFPHSVGGDLTLPSLKSAIRLNPKLHGRVMQFNAEQLPVRAESVHFVYSFGVIHHTPTIENVIREIHRILKPGGGGLIHIYHKNSPKGMLVRLFRTFLKVQFFYDLLLKIFPNRGTAVAELCLCPIMNFYSKSDVRRLFSEFTDIQFRPNHLGLIHLIHILGFKPTSMIYRMMLPIELTFSPWLGFHLVFTFRKPART